jgi:hypothetical protein
MNMAKATSVPITRHQSLQKRGWIRELFLRGLHNNLEKRKVNSKDAYL